MNVLIFHYITLELIYIIPHRQKIWTSAKIPQVKLMYLIILQIFTEAATF